MQYSPERHPGRRSMDPHGLMKNPTIRSIMAILIPVLSTLSLYFWNESRQALNDIYNSKLEIKEVKAELSYMNIRIENSDKITQEQRTEFKGDLNRLENKVDKIINILVRK